MFEDYVNGLEEQQRHALQRVIDHVARVAPDATEGRSYGVPAFRHRDRPLLGFAAARKHLSLYPFSPSALDSVKDRLAEFELAKGTIRFAADHPIPDEIVTEIVQARIAEIEAR